MIYMAICLEGSVYSLPVISLKLPALRDQIITMEIGVTVSEWEVWVFLVTQVWSGSDWRIQWCLPRAWITPD